MIFAVVSADDSVFGIGADIGTLSFVGTWGWLVLGCNHVPWAAAGRL
jgi:hypothetical protein